VAVRPQPGGNLVATPSFYSLPHSLSHPWLREGTWAPPWLSLKRPTAPALK